jgi:hypothetical protein
MKQIGFCLCLFSSVCWCQGIPVHLDVPAPIEVKVETDPQARWPLVFQITVPVLSALVAVWLTNRNNQRTNEANWRHEMLSRRAERRLEVLSRIGQLIIQARNSLKRYEDATELCDKHAQAQTSRAEQDAVGEARRKASQELSAKREELAAENGASGFVLSDDLWHKLQTLEQSFTDVCTVEKNTKEGRAAQLKILFDQINDFIVVARGESELASSRSANTAPPA